MKEKVASYLNINEAEIVNQHREAADRIEGDPQKMLALIDLIFGFTESQLPPS